MRIFGSILSYHQWPCRGYINQWAIGLRIELSIHDQCEVMAIIAKLDVIPDAWLDSRALGVSLGGAHNQLATKNLHEPTIREPYTVGEEHWHT